MYYYISPEDDDHLPDLVLEPKSIQKKKVKFLFKEDDSKSSKESSSDVSPDISLDTTSKVPPNSPAPASSDPDILLTQR